MSNEIQTTLNVDGMTCNSCVRHIGDALTKISGVKDFKINMAGGMVSIDHDREKVTVPMLIASLEDAGYQSRPAQSLTREGVTREK